MTFWVFPLTSIPLGVVLRTLGCTIDALIQLDPLRGVLRTLGCTIDAFQPFFFSSPYYNWPNRPSRTLPQAGHNLCPGCIFQPFVGVGSGDIKRVGQCSRSNPRNIC